MDDHRVDAFVSLHNCGSAFVQPAGRAHSQGAFTERLSDRYGAGIKRGAVHSFRGLSHCLAGRSLRSALSVVRFDWHLEHILGSIGLVEILRRDVYCQRLCWCW